MIFDDLEITVHARDRMKERKVPRPKFLRRLRPYEVRMVSSQFAEHHGKESGPSFKNRSDTIYCTYGEYGRLPLYVLRSKGKRCYTLITCWWVDIPPETEYDRTVVDREAIRVYGSAPIYYLSMVGQRGNCWCARMEHPDGRTVKASGKNKREALHKVLVKYFKHKRKS